MIMMMRFVDDGNNGINDNLNKIVLLSMSE